MAIIDIHILVQSLLYFFTCICGLTVSITMGVNKDHFAGYCILYTTVKGGLSDVAKCDFPLFFSIFGLAIGGMALCIYFLYMVKRSNHDHNVGSKMFVLPFVLTNAVLAVFTFIMACMISVGYTTFCNSIEDQQPGIKCSVFEHQKFKIGRQTIHTANFTSLMTTAMAGAWLALLCLLLQVALGILRFIRNRKRMRAESTKSTSKSDNKEMERY